MLLFRHPVLCTLSSFAKQQQLFVVSLWIGLLRRQLVDFHGRYEFSLLAAIMPYFSKNDCFLLLSELPFCLLSLSARHLPGRGWLPRTYICNHVHFFLTNVKFRIIRLKFGGSSSAINTSRSARILSSCLHLGKCNPLVYGYLNSEET